MDLKAHVLSSIKGAHRRALVAQLFEDGRETEIPLGLLQSALSDDDRRFAGAFHPSFMGGEYLPDREEGEVEIARITLASVTQDVTSVYAARTGDGVRFRVVDEYEGMTLTGISEKTAGEPLTLGELFDFFLGTFDLFFILKMNFQDCGYQRDRVLGFFEGSSEFYPDWDQLVRSRVEAWLEEHAPEPDLEDEVQE